MAKREEISPEGLNDTFSLLSVIIVSGELVISSGTLPEGSGLSGTRLALAKLVLSEECNICLVVSSVTLELSVVLEEMHMPSSPPKRLKRHLLP